MRLVRWALCLLIITDSTAWAWGERGHDIVARVASRLIAAKAEPPTVLQTPFLLKEMMLAHLANVPDIVWRADYQASDIRNKNAPTHFIGVDLIQTKCIYDRLPKQITKAATLARAQKTNLYLEVGTAPWRVQQFYDLMVADLKQAKAAGSHSKKMIAHVNQALLHAGLMAHFVGDLGNPMHTTKDYDGWDNDQGGLHKYFESDIVDAMLLSLVNEVHVFAQMKRPFASKLQPVLGSDNKDASSFGLNAAFALVCDSFGELKRLRKLDLQHSLKTRSRQVGISRMIAERKPAAEVKDHFKPLIIERLAMAADTLSEVWYRAWLEAGQPDMSTFESYEYPVQPNFIQPDYLPDALPEGEQTQG